MKKTICILLAFSVIISGCGQTIKQTGPNRVVQGDLRMNVNEFPNNPTLTPIQEEEMPELTFNPIIETTNNPTNLTSPLNEVETKTIVSEKGLSEIWNPEFDEYVKDTNWGEVIKHISQSWNVKEGDLIKRVSYNKNDPEYRDLILTDSHLEDFIVWLNPKIPGHTIHEAYME